MRLSYCDRQELVSKPQTWASLFTEKKPVHRHIRVVSKRSPGSHYIRVVKLKSLQRFNEGRVQGAVHDAY